MAFDQNSIPKDLRPVNMAGVNTEDARIAPVTATSGRYPDVVYSNPPPPRGDISSPPSVPVYYSAVTTSDAGFVGLGFGKSAVNPVHPPAAVPAWAPRMPAPVPIVGLSQQVSTTSISPTGYTGGPQFGTRVIGRNTADQTIDGGDDSVSGKKVKFLCSFGGKIIPRPCDGKLRYVGGQTRIISVRRDVNFGEFVQKMVDTYGQPVVIKYQLPEEDLDALVSVSCPDDLDNMMDEYEKLVERSSDGSAKLRVFLFSATELDSSGLVQYGDLQDSGQRYVDAVNGIMEGVGGGLTRKGSIASATSTQNSDASGTEPFDAAFISQDVTGPPPTGVLSPKNDIAVSTDIAAKPLCVDANPTVANEAPAAAPLVVPVTSGPSQAIPLQPEVELKQTTSQPLQQHATYDFQQAGVKFPPPPSSYLQGYVDPHQMDYSKVPPQTVYTNPQVVAPPRPILIQPSYHDNPPNVVSQQFIPAVHMTMAPTSSHLSMNPNMMQHQRVIANYSGYQGQVPMAGVTTGYNWHQVPSNQEHMGFSKGYAPQQQVPRMDDCYMCQTALPHAHSDPVPQKQSNTSPTTASDTNPVYHSLCLDDVSKINTQNNVVVSGPSGEPPIAVDGDNADPFRIVNAHSNEHVKAPIAQARKDDTANLQQQALANPVLEASYQQNNLPMELHEGTQAPGIHVDGNAACFAVDSAYRQSSAVPPNWNEDNQDHSSLFSIQDPWSTRYDNHFPPPRPSKIATKKEASSPKDPYTQQNWLGGETRTQIVDVVDMQSPNLMGDHSSELSTKGSAEDLIKQELQATAEGVATSVLQSSVPSNPDSSSHEQELQNDSDAVLHAKLEGMNIKPEKTNLGFPLSESLGRLQIIKNSDLEELQELGSGTFGTVYHGKWRGTDVAIKRINDRCFAGKPSEQERMKNDFWNEAIKLADLHHPNVVAFYGVVLDGPGGSVATVTEYMVNGSLRTALQKNERTLDKKKRLLITMDVAFGMEYLHSRNIVHFDLKSDNLLVNLRDPHRPICKVGDLGLSKVKCQTLISGGVRGTLPWMAPELLNGSSSLVSEKVDVFSFGIVMWELLTGEEPYSDLYYGAIIGGIVSNTLRPPVPDNCDPDWKSLMERCWSAEPSERPSFTEIANELRTMATKIPSKGQNPGGGASNPRMNG